MVYVLVLVLQFNYVVIISARFYIVSFSGIFIYQKPKTLIVWVGET